MLRDWYYYDFLVVTADAYIDHPASAPRSLPGCWRRRAIEVAILA